MSEKSPADLQAAVDFYLAEMRAGDFDSAAHGLLCFDPGVVPLLCAVFDQQTSEDSRCTLMRIAREYRLDTALPMLEAGLRDRRPDVWKAALDGFVTVASPTALDSLQSFAAEAAFSGSRDADFIDWVREAIQQIEEARAARPAES
ncbi:MAG: hypothetical protein ABI639_02875 [Thermoanaerobaculia bacterium]